MKWPTCSHYLVRLADKLDVNLLEAARDKVKRNAEKYPSRNPAPRQEVLRAVGGTGLRIS
jgi:hypothetical protein